MGMVGTLTLKLFLQCRLELGAVLRGGCAVLRVTLLQRQGQALVVHRHQAAQCSVNSVHIAQCSYSTVFSQQCSYSTVFIARCSYSTVFSQQCS